MTRFEKLLATSASFAALLLLSAVSLFASKADLRLEEQPPAQTDIVIRIDGFTAYRLPLFR